MKEQLAGCLRLSLRWPHALAFVVLVLSACAFHPTGKQQPVDDRLTLCHEPRPQMCTRDYRPVCGERQDGETKTYANACEACADAAVIGSRKGECKENR